jgi:cation diffusion facilitator CzcD-associated flavoprotein CzcO
MVPAESLFGGNPTPRVVVVGAGFAGIAAGVKLKRAGVETFTIFEKSVSPGGTWFENRYPGAEVDTESNLYCFSFKLHDWTRTHVRQAELEQYLLDTIAEFGLEPHLRLGTAVRSAVWDDAAQHYTLTLADGSQAVFDVVVSAVGLLNTPRYPDWPGLETFEGPKFHTSAWEHEHDLTGMRVAVVGTGSSSAQVVPNIVDRVGRLILFQREPASVLPKNARDYSARERAVLNLPFVRRLDRWRLFLRYERQPAARRRGSRLNRRAAERCHSYLQEMFADRPDLLAALTPRYAMYGKRVVLDDSFYAALKRDNVVVVPHPVVRVTPRGVVDATGVEHEVDVLVMATGFQPSNFLASLDVVGRGGRSLHEVWTGEPYAFLGLTVDGFPNFYMLYGPNTNSMVAVFTLECQAGYVARAVRRMAHRRIASLEVRRSYVEWHNHWLEKRMRRVPAWTETNNYYKSPSGRVVTQWPAGAYRYALMTRLLLGPSSIARRQGETAAAKGLAPTWV